MKNKTMNLYCPKCDIDNYLKGIEQKVDFNFIGIYAGERVMNDGKHNFDYLELMKYQVDRK